MKIISFCLWGQELKYTIGALKNADLAKKYYPDWICRFHCDETVPEEIINNLINKENCEIKMFSKSNNWKFTLSRLLPLDDPSVKIVIFRDTDSRISEREVSAVQEWLKKDKSCHIMRDHPYHGGFPILAGMFGLKNNIKFNIIENIKNFKCQEQYHYDQIFINEFIYPFIKNDYLIHDEFFEKKPFPAKRQNYEFVGQVFDENDQTVKEHVEVIKKFYENRNS
jgi:hypothetical protein